VIVLRMTILRVMVLVLLVIQFSPLLIIFSWYMPVVKVVYLPIFSLVFGIAVTCGREEHHFYYYLTVTSFNRWDFNRCLCLVQLLSFLTALLKNLDEHLAFYSYPEGQPMCLSLSNLKT
jgi:hypothetical protein